LALRNASNGVLPKPSDLSTEGMEVLAVVDGMKDVTPTKDQQKEMAKETP
jgi:hypothetical protein